MKNILLGLLLLLTLHNLSAQKKERVIKDSLNADSLLNFAKQFLGCKYKYAQSSCEKGFDCSGFVSYCFKNFKIQLPRSATDYVSIGIDIPKDSCKPGDILVIKGRNEKSKSAGHVAIVTENTGKDFYFIHASSNKTKGGVIISSFNSSKYYEKRFIKIIRVAICN